MKKILVSFLLIVFILPAFSQNVDEFKFSLIPRRMSQNAYAFALNQNLSTTDSPTFAGLTLNNGTATGIVALPDGSLVIGGKLATPKGTLTGCTIGTVNLTNGTTVLNKTAHGVTFIQGDIIAITSCTTAANLGVYFCTTTTTSSSLNYFGIAGVLSGSDTDVAVTIYNRTFVVDNIGRLMAFTKLTAPLENAFSLSYEVDQASGLGRGLEIFFGSPLSHWGDGATYHHPINVYRNLWKEGEIFYLDALGNILSTGNTTLVNGKVSGGNLEAQKTPTLAAPTVTPHTAGAATWTYKYVVNLADGSHSEASPAGSTTAGPSDLTGSYNTIVVPYIVGAYTIDIYRTVSGTTPSTTGKIITASPATLRTTAVNTFYDTGLAGDASTAPTTNTTGIVSGTGAYFAGNVGIGTSTPGAACHIYGDVNAPVSAWVLNPNAGTAAKSQILVGQTNSSFKYGIFQHWGTGYIKSGLAVANRSGLLGYDTEGLVVGTGTANPLIFGTNNIERGSIDSNGNIVFNDGGYDADFRIESDQSENALRVDGETGAITGTMIDNTDSDTDEIDSVTFSGGCGLVMAFSSTDNTSAIWKLKGTAFEEIEVDADWTATKDNAATYNVYIESGAIKLQNKVGENKAVRLGFWGI